MTKASQTTSGKSVVLITVSGQDAPGITSEMTGILAQGQVNILDIGQAVIHGLLSLSILFELDGEAAHKTIIKDLLFKAHEMGMKLEFRVLTDQLDSRGQFRNKAYRYALTLIAQQITA